jgi:glucose/arabinose dehydrogenase
MLHRHTLDTVALLIAALLVTAACSGASQEASRPDGRQPATAPAPVLPTPTPAASAPATTTAAIDPVLLPTPTPVPTATTAVIDPATLTLNLAPVVEGISQPLFVTHADDGSGRLFIVEKTGAIRILQDGTLLDEPFLDLSARVSGGFEQGLLGMAFPPNFADSGYFFVNYTEQQGATRVTRFRVSADNPNRADPASESSVLSIDQPAPNHNGGMLAFGPDGMLYVGTGDGGAANDRFENGQNPTTLLGKLLRLDVTSTPDQPYVIPADNPWLDDAWNGQDVRDEIWAVGLRNPWRFSFDRATGDLWLADVGQSQWEEVNSTAAGSRGGLNYGWPLMEGLHCFQNDDCDATDLVLPVHEYGHTGHCSVTGGYVYRGQARPNWQGAYFYGDYCSGTIWALTPDGSGGWVNTEVAQPDITLSSFGEDEAGELYATDLGGNVYRLE